MKKNFSTEKVVKRWTKLPRKVVESPCLEVKDIQMWHLGTRFSAGLVSAR